MKKHTEAFCSLGSNKQVIIGTIETSSKCPRSKASVKRWPTVFGRFAMSRPIGTPQLRVEAYQIYPTHYGEKNIHP